VAGKAAGNFSREPGSYSPTLVAMSVLVAMMASYSALDFAGRVAFSTGRATRLWLVGGALAMGAGIWSMHFIGMLAFSLPVPLAYDVIGMRSLP
jgi:NO-binding membrane sensor protein with MHYT domain